MDPSEPGDRCLPGMGLSGWMKRTMERSYDLTDICSSPPVDGFFYPSAQKGIAPGVAGKGNCAQREDTRSCTIMGSVLSINQPLTPHLSHTLGGGDPTGFGYGGTTGISQMGGGGGVGCTPAVKGESSSAVQEHVGGKAVVVTGFTSGGIYTKQLSQGLNKPPAESPMSPEDNRSAHISLEDVRNWANSDDSHHAEMKSHPSDDSAPSPVDHLVSNRYSSMVTRAEDGSGSRSLRLVEKLGAGSSSLTVSPDVTPCTTPAVTPACSPQVARRTGNPFFTGGDNDNPSSGSWLFRPGKKANDGSSIHSEKLYETKIEFQQQPNSKIAKKTVRYVPRPSELRELNFWSPTSM